MELLSHTITLHRFMFNFLRSCQNVSYSLCLFIFKLWLRYDLHKEKGLTLGVQLDAILQCHPCGTTSWIRFHPGPFPIILLAPGYQPCPPLLSWISLPVFHCDVMEPAVHFSCPISFTQHHVHLCSLLSARQFVLFLFCIVFLCAYPGVKLLTHKWASVTLQSGPVISSFYSWNFSRGRSTSEGLGDPLGTGKGDVSSMTVSTSPNSGMLAARPIWLPSETSLADDLIASPVAKLGGVVGQAAGSPPGMSSAGRNLRYN